MRALIVTAMLAAFAAGPAAAQDQEKAEIIITNDSNTPVVMSFDYAFRDYTWNLITHEIPARDEITYRFPSNIPGCQYLREWRITDGLLKISSGGSVMCEQRISLCDKRASTMAVRGNNRCNWKD
jgi:hypothetical protein